jgi:porphobilinogen synthase
LCSYTTHGHCGILADSEDHVDNGQSVTALAKAALAYAEAGADCVAPSDMMDHRVRAIREILDQHKLHQTLIMSYSAKFHSGFYGPFRAAADSAPKGNSKITDRATYQIDPAHPSDALRSSLRDQDEGADILMVKPGLPYLDVLKELSSQIPLPWAVYEVSGEYAAIELMAEKGLIDARRAHLESWTAFFRAGAQMVITYGARNAKEWMKE